MALRAIALVSRFVLVLGLARLFSPEEVGLYGLVAATVSFGMLVVGGEFYTFSQRELLAGPRARSSFVLQHQGIATTAMYIVLLPLLGSVFWLGLIPLEWIGWYFALLVSEHLGQELNRLLIALGRPIMASVVLVLRTGAWVWVVIPLLWNDPSARSLGSVFAAWLIGGAAAVVMALLVVAREVAPWRWWSVDWSWIRRGLRTGLMFLVATLSFKFLFTADRYMMQWLAGSDVLGAYVVYAGIATAVTTFLDSAVFSFLYPELVTAYHHGQHQRYASLMRELRISAIGLGGALVVGAALLAPTVLGWIGKGVYIVHVPILWALLLTTFIQAMSMVPHYGLYAHRADRSLLVAHGSAVAVFLLVTLALSRAAPTMAVALGLLAAFSWVAVFKQGVYNRLVTSVP